MIRVPKKAALMLLVITCPIVLIMRQCYASRRINEQRLDDSIEVQHSNDDKQRRGW